MDLRTQIIRHTKLGQSIRLKLKRMIEKLNLPDVEIERHILTYIGIPEFSFCSFFKNNFIKMNI